MKKKTILATMLAAIACCSTVMTSCSKDEDGENRTLDEALNGESDKKTFEANGFSVFFPRENCSFKATTLEAVSIPNVGEDKHLIALNYYLCYDTIVPSARIHFYSSFLPSQVQASDFDDVHTIFEKYYYPDGEGFRVLKNEKVKFSSYDSWMMQMIQQKDLDAPTPVPYDVYKERHLIYSESRKQIFSILIEMPDSLRESHYQELYGYASTFRLNKSK